MTFQEQFDDIYGELHLMNSDHIRVGEIGEKLIRLFKDELFLVKNELIRQEGRFINEKTALEKYLIEKHKEEIEKIDIDHCEKLTKVVEEIEQKHKISLLKPENTKSVDIPCDLGDIQAIRF